MWAVPGSVLHGLFVEHVNQGASTIVVQLLAIARASDWEVFIETVLQSTCVAILNASLGDPVDSERLADGPLNRGIPLGSG